MTPSWQTGELSREGGGRALGEERPQVGAAQAGDVEAGTLQGREQALFDAAEKIEALKIAPLDGTRLGEPVERADAGREIVQTGEVFEITAVAAEQDFTQVDEAVDRLSDGGEGAGCRTLPMFHLAVVLESGDVVGGGLQAQDEAEFVINLDRGFAETMPDAGPVDPRCELTADLFGELGSDPVAKEGGDVFGADSDDADMKCPWDSSAVKAFGSLGLYFGQLTHIQDVHMGMIDEPSPPSRDIAKYFTDISSAINAFEDWPTKVQLHAPFLSMSKADVIRIGAGISVNLGETWSCFENNAGTLRSMPSVPISKVRVSISYCPRPYTIFIPLNH